MNVLEIINSGTNVQIVINALDLKEAFLAWSEELKSKQEPERKEETFLDSKEAMEKLGVDYTTLWRWDKTGYLKKVKLGKKPFWRLSDIEKLMEG